ncbi:MAG: carboxypeptidase regulatory-like domain-containing protein [Caldilineaceae bacterium]|nr:carboxypeptidase regulatory-like domain-containing protein [Caldilineaceae bacterium]
MRTHDSSLRITRAARRTFPLLFGLALCFLFALGLTSVATATPAEPEALGSISGNVTDVAGQPITGVNVTVYRNLDGYAWLPVRIVQSDDAGAYRVPALRAGIYRLQFRDPQGIHAQEYYNDALTVESAADIPVAGNNVTGVDVTLTAAAQISGVASIPDVPMFDFGYAYLYTQVGAYWQPITATGIATPTSEYRFGELLPGVYRVCGFAVIGIEYFQDSFRGCYGGATVDSAQDIVLAAGETVANIDLRLGEGEYDGQITGTVTSGGAPLAGIKVSLYATLPPEDPTLPVLPLVYTYTNAAGDYVVGGLAEGFYIVTFSDPNGDYTTRYFRDHRRPFEAEYLLLRTGQTLRNINANLQRGGGISGRIRYADGRPATWSNSQLLWFNGEYWEPVARMLTLDGAGRYTLKPLEPGRYHICFPFEVFLGGQFPSPYPNWYFYQNCYGTDRFSNLGPDQAADITVTAGVTTPGIDAIIGPELIYMPVVGE